MKIVTPADTPAEIYEQLDGWLTDILGASGATLDDEVLGMLDVFDRQLRIGLGLPVDVEN